VNILIQIDDCFIGMFDFFFFGTVREKRKTQTTLSDFQNFDLTTISSSWVDSLMF
jgi:hypothetical protein